jgi:hypothetical protein
MRCRFAGLKLAKNLENRQFSVFYDPYVFIPARTVPFVGVGPKVGA